MEDKFMITLLLTLFLYNPLCPCVNKAQVLVGKQWHLQGYSLGITELAVTLQHFSLCFATEFSGNPDVD